MYSQGLEMVVRDNGQQEQQRHIKIRKITYTKLYSNTQTKRKRITDYYDS